MNRTVPIASIKAGDSPRLDGENQEHIAILASSEKPLPPILVHKPTMRVIDGMHRLRAAYLRGDLTVEVQFFDGNEDEAFMAAVQANVTHGLPLTLADREAAALRLIRSDPHRSDRLIANVTGLSAATVASRRRRADIAAHQVMARIGRDGRIRPLNIATGRLRVQEEIFNNPQASVREIARAAGVSLSTVSDVRKRMRQGEDPVPSSHRSKSLRVREPTAPPSGQALQDAASLLKLLHKDPSLRYNEPGRALLRWLEFHARGPETVCALADAVPPHCRYAVARLIRRCADEWQKLACALEQGGRLR
jgi:DNA-binding CsgD family transcriptional regulator/transposase-like protein